MAFSKFELSQLYKVETSRVPSKVACDARVGKYGDVILDGNDLDDDFKEFIGMDGANKWVEFPDLEYTSWLEQKVIELLNKQ